jgi:hypothetical protein
MSCPSCSARTRGDLGTTCPACGFVSVGFLDGYLNLPPAVSAAEAIRAAQVEVRARGASPEAAQRLFESHLRTALESGAITTGEAYDLGHEWGGTVTIPANTLRAGERYRIAAGERFYTVPWDPDLEGENLKGGALRTIFFAALVATAEGWSAETLRQRPRWHEPTIAGAAVRTAVRWGLIP